MADQSSTYRCPVCQGDVDRNADTCPRCGLDIPRTGWVEGRKPPQFPNSASERFLDAAAFPGMFLGMFLLLALGTFPVPAVAVAGLLCFLPLAILLLAMLVVGPIRTFFAKMTLDEAQRAAQSRAGRFFASYGRMSCPHCARGMPAGFVEASIRFDLWGKPRCKGCNGRLEIRPKY